MSAAAVETAPPVYVDADLNGPLKEDDAKKIRQQIRDGWNDRRKRMDPLWQECLAFAEGKHHLKQIDRNGRRQLVLPPLRPGELRYAVDELSKYRQTLLGEMSLGDDRPQIMFRQEDQQDQDIADQGDDLLAYGWEAEWNGEEALEDVKRFLIDTGTSATRCRWDPTAGAVRIRVPVGPDGAPQLDPALVSTLAETGQMPDGSLPKFKTVHEGRIRWEAGSGFNLIVPPGVKRERDFPWECWVSATAVGKLVEQYPKAKGIKPDELADVNQLTNTAGTNEAQPGKLSDHILVFTYYQRSTAKYGKGRTIVLAGQRMQVLDVQEQLPYEAPDGTWRSGIHYFHYIRLSDRFWSKGMVESALDPCRAIDKRRAQSLMIGDRSMPKVYAAKGSITKMPQGVPLEVVWTDPQKPKPVIDNGPGVPTWIQADIEALREDLARSVGVQDVTRGENPTGANTYSAVALLAEQDRRSLDPIVKSFQKVVCHLVEDSLYSIRQYWPAEKQISVAGPDGTLRAFTFQKSDLPDLMKVTIAEDDAKPRSQAAMLKMVDDIATYSVNSRQPLPVDWVLRSYKSGQPVDLPPAPTNAQVEKAQYENQLLVEGQPVTVDYFDNHALHVAEHRQVQVQARLSGRQDIWDAVEQHVQEHLAASAQNAQLVQPPPTLPPAGAAAVPPGPPLPSALAPPAQPSATPIP